MVMEAGIHQKMASLTFHAEGKYISNVCLIKIRSKHSSNTLLHLLRFFMRQTLLKL